VRFLREVQLVLHRLLDNEQLYLPAFPHGILLQLYLLQIRHPRNRIRGGYVPNRGSLPLLGRLHILCVLLLHDVRELLVFHPEVERIEKSVRSMLLCLSKLMAL
jgi:hypothetical protein